MKNQKGEVTLLGVLTLVLMSGLILLAGLKLQLAFSNLKNRTHLFLCVKETKGEFHNYMKLMGRTNWAIRNTTRASLVMLFIPGLQGAAMDAQKLKRAIKLYQNSIVLISYLEKLSSLKSKGCPIDPRMFITPFRLGGSLYERDSSGAAILREKEWNYHYYKKPYALSLKVQASKYESINPQISFQAEEKMAKLSSLYSSLP